MRWGLAGLWTALDDPEVRQRAELGIGGIAARVGGCALAVGSICGSVPILLRWLDPPPPPKDIGDALAAVGPLGLGFLVICLLTAPFGAVIGWLWVIVRLGRDERRCRRTG